MLRELRCALLVAAAVALLFSAGCVSEKEFEKARFECIELSSGAYSDVPECDSQEKCFGELEARAFGFSDERLSFDVRQGLFYYKNHVARSWFYFNLARDRTREIQGICIKGRGFERLPTLANELNNYLTNAFGEADKANKQSLIVLALESAELEKNQVSLIREEALFDVRIKIHNNLNSLDKNFFGKSYYARYLGKVREFNELSEKKGFAPLTVENFGFEELVFAATSRYSKEIISVFVEKNFMLPFMSDSLSSFASFLSGRNSLSESLKSLKNSPMFEFMALYSDLLGENESVLSGFSKLMKEDCVSREFVALENEKLEATAETKLKDIKERILRIPFEEFEFLDSDSVSGLNTFSGESELSYREFDFETLKEGWINSSVLVESLEFELHEIRSNQLLERISIGEKTSRLKKLNFELNKLIDSLEFVERDLLGGFITDCEKEIQRIELELSTETALVELKLRVEGELAKFKNAETASEKIVCCTQAIELFNRLKNEAENLEETKNLAWTEIGGCLDRLDLYLTVLTETNPSLGRTVKQFKEGIDSGSFTNETAETCYLLETAANQSLRESLELEEIEIDFLEAKKLIEKIRFVLRERPAMASNSIKSLETETVELEVFFKNKQLVLEKAIENIQSIRWRCRELKNKGREEVGSLLEDFLSENFSLKAMPIEDITAGKEFKALYLIEFSNPFFSWSEPLAFSIPLSQKFDGFELKSQNIISAEQKNRRLRLELSSVPEGKTFAEFYSTCVVSFVVKTEIKEISSLTAEIEKTIEFNSNGTVSKLNVLVPFEFGALEYSNLRAFFKGKRAGVGIKDNSLSLVLEDVLSREKALVYFTVFEPVTFKKTLIERKKIDTNQSLERVLLSVKNNLSYHIKKTSLVVPFESNSEFIESIELFDEHGAKKIVRVVPGGLVVEITGFAPGEERNWELKYRINNETAYFEGKKEELENRLGVLDAVHGEIGAEASELLELVNGLGSIEFVENQEALGRAFDKLLVLESKHEKEMLLDEEIEFFELELAKKIALLEKEMGELDSNQPQVIELRELIVDSKKKLGEVSELKKTNKPKALELVYITQAQLAGFSIQNNSTEIKKQSIELLEEINSIKKQAESLGVRSVGIESSARKATELFLKLEEFVGRGEYWNTVAILEELEELVEKTRTEFEDAFGLEIEALASNLNKFVGGAASVKAKIERLKLEFSSVSVEELINTKTMLPFKKELVYGLEEEFNSVNSKYSDKFNDVLFKITEGKHEEALNSTNKTEVKTALTEIGSLEERAGSMELSLKTSALTELTNAKEKLSELDTEGILKLEEAVSEANKNNYLKALVLSRAALATASPQELNFTLLLYPVFVALAILSVRSLKKKKEIPKPVLRRIPRRY